MRTRSTVALVAATQLALVALAVAPRLSAWATGEEYALRVAGYDPHDPFRGAYTQLDYPDLDLHPRRRAPEGRVYLPLERDGEVWVSSGTVAERPDAGPYLACEGDGWQVSCGIESWFSDDTEALRVGAALAARGGTATVRVDGRGNAVLVDVRADGDLSR